MRGGYTLITGGAGFIGCNLADAILADGGAVVVADNFSRPGVRSNAAWLRNRHGGRVRIENADVRDAARVAQLVAGAREIFHLAAQVAVTTSFEDPVLDLHTNLLGTFNLLEAARALPSPPPLLFTSTNKVYGELSDLPVQKNGGAYEYADGGDGVSESAPLDFHSPYGCSKGAADQYVRDYARVFGLRTLVFRMSCIYGTRQLGTEDQGWVAHFARSLLVGRPITVYGDGCQVRDILWIGDLVAALRTAMANVERLSGSVFNIGGGSGNAVSVRRVIDRLQEITGREVPVEADAWRPGDQRIYVSDTSHARDAFGWRPRMPWEKGLERLVEWLNETELPALHSPAPARRESRPVLAVG
ncbi:GDP-mannose 4,6-dehydratase [soil metagenome]